jgi:signal transduction histidine kinase
MFDQTQSTRETSVRLEDVVAQSLDLDLDLANSVFRVHQKTIVEPEVRQAAGRRRLSLQIRQRAKRRASRYRLNNESLVVFSHEVRSSLGAIHNAAHILRILDAETSIEAKARLLIERQVARITQLVDDLVKVSRIRGAELPLKRERVDLRVVVKHAIETVEADLAVRHHRLTTSLPEMPIWLRGDPSRLEQVWVNLLANAAKYTDDGGDLHLSVEHKAGTAIVRICDSGIGIAPDVLPRVFNLFMQADHSARRVEAGLGIGLALVRRLVEMHGGSITAASAGLGRGSEFTVLLPTICE